MTIKHDLYILDIDGKTPKVTNDLIIWSNFFRSMTRRVAQDKVEKILISTVFLGLNHNFSSTGPPILFETMIFGGKHDKYQRRYSTWEQANKGHQEALKLVKR
jgi:hypothetical protein